MNYSLYVWIKNSDLSSNHDRNNTETNRISDDFYRMSVLGIRSQDIVNPWSCLRMCVRVWLKRGTQAERSWCEGAVGVGTA